MQLKSSSLVLIAANLLPIGGVLWFDWSVFEILLLYWTESVIIGVINVLRMLASRSGNVLEGFAGMRGEVPAAASAAMNAAVSRMARRGIKGFLIPFFIVHYGVFCYGHLSAVVGIFSDRGLHGGLLGAVPPLSDLAFWALVASIFASHLFSFFANFIGKGEYRRTGVAALMHRPYGRIVVMHITVIFGAGLVMWLDNPLPMLVVLVAAKIILDLKLHNRERQRFANVD